MTKDLVLNDPKAYYGFGVARWKRSRYYAVYDQYGELVCLAVYKKGAIEVARRLSERTTR